METVQELMKLSKYTVLCFVADWCHHCVEYTEVFKTASKEFKPVVTFALVDADTCVEFLESVNIHNLPTLVFCKDGEVAFTHVGKMSLEETRNEVLKLLGAENEVHSYQ